ncbi:MAG: HPP family protein [Alphaproteobacteria bacterium]
MDKRPLEQSLLRALCGGAAVALMIAIADATGQALLWLPFTTSIVMVLGSPEVAAAHPRRVLGGHLVCAASGIACTLALGVDPLVAALAIAVSMLAMQTLDVFHPPAGITPMIIVASKADPLFILSPVLAGTIILLGFSAICRKLSGKGSGIQPD